MVTGYLGLGSNQGDRRKNIILALEMLSEYGTIEESSSFYETEPEGYMDQPWFLNMVCRYSTKLSPIELLRALKGIERKLGRVNTFRNGPRVIDIDILLYNEEQVKMKGLIIPHPQMIRRAFVLVPLVEIAPHLTVTGTGKTVTQYLDSLNYDREKVRLSGMTG